MITHIDSNNRTKIVNPLYIELKELRGSNFDIQQHYINLRRNFKTTQFLFKFPMYREIFFLFFTQYNSLVNDVYNAYKDRFISRTYNYESQKYQKLINQIHQNVYLPSLGDIYKKNKIKKDIIECFLENLPTITILYYINMV